MAISTRRLVAELGVNEGQARTIRGLMIGAISPFTIAQTEAWRRQCYHEPHETAPETIMHAIDGVLETCGTEAIWSNRSCTRPVAEYCNTGDSYAATVLYDYMSETYKITSWGAWIERYGRRYGVE